MGSGGGCGLEEKSCERSVHTCRSAWASVEENKAHLLWMFHESAGPLRLTFSTKLNLTSQLELSLSFQDLFSPQIFVHMRGVGVRVVDVWIGNELVVIVDGVGVIGRLPDISHLLPVEIFGMTCSRFTFPRNVFSSNRPGVGVLVREAVNVWCVTNIDWLVDPHLWERHGRGDG